MYRYMYIYRYENLKCAFYLGFLIESSPQVFKRKQTQKLTPEQVSELWLLMLLKFDLTPQMVLSDLGLQKDQIPEKKKEQTFVSSNQVKRYGKNIF